LDITSPGLLKGNVMASIAGCSERDFWPCNFIAKRTILVKEMHETYHFHRLTSNNCSLFRFVFDFSS
jgi:hypothetical protein